ncbi:hypothetical protein Tco_0522601 [Tanacetum coccineum]
MSSPGAPSAPSTPPSYFQDLQHLQAILQDLHHLPNFRQDLSRKASCSNCKALGGKISELKATMDYAYASGTTHS